MARNYRLIGTQSFCVMFTFLLATTAHATLSNCSQASTDSTCTPVISAMERPVQTPVAEPATSAISNAAHSEFQIGHSQSTNALPETVSLLLLLGALLIVVLVRTKRFNSK